ncbi:hypothetical protein ES708_21034 [subsurface metagenome]
MERVDDNEQRIAPLPGIVVLTELVTTNRGQGVVVSRIESVCDRAGVVLFSCNYAHEGFAGSVIKIPALFILVISYRQEYRS